MDWKTIDATTPDGLRELDRVIAERLGVTIEVKEYQGLSEYWPKLGGKVYADPAETEAKAWDNVPYYTTDLNAAFDLIKEVPATFRLQSSAPNIWQAFFLHPVNTQATDDTPALVICQVWLAWKDATE